jgi:hypothetical protein
MRANVGSGDIDIVAEEAPVISVVGTPIPSYNTNRSSSNTASMLIYGAPTVSSPGTEVHSIWVPPTAAGQGGSEQGVLNADAGEEWVLKPNTDYTQILTNNILTNNSGETIDAWFEIVWYEL